MFFEMLLNNLNTHDQIEHSINFVKKKTSRIDCVYNMSQNKLAALWNYIANALKKIKFALSTNRSKHLFYLWKNLIITCDFASTIENSTK